MTFFQSIKKKIRSFDSFVQTITISTDGGQGYQSIVGGLGTILIYLFIFGLSLYLFANSLSKSSNPNQSSTDHDLTFINTSFSTSFSQDNVVLAISYFNSKCSVIDIEKNLYNVSKDCLLELMDGSLFLKRFQFGNGLISLLANYDDLIPIISLMSDCPQNFIQSETFHNYKNEFMIGFEEEGDSIGIDEVFVDNITFCIQNTSNTTIFTKPLAWQQIDFFYKQTYNFTNDIYALFMNNLSAITQEYQNSEEELHEQYVGNDGYLAFALNELKQTFQAQVYNLKSGFSDMNVFRLLIQHDVIDPIQESLIGKPVTSQLRVVDSLMYACVNGEISFNTGKYNSTYVQIKKRKISSNYGYGYMWRSSHDWDSVYASLVDHVQDNNLVGPMLYKLATISLDLKQEDLQITYQTPLSIFTTIGGITELLGRVAVIFLAYNHFQMILKYYTKFSSKSKDTLHKPIPQNVIGFICYYFYKILYLKKCFRNSRYNVNLESFEREIFSKLDLKKIIKMSASVKYIKSNLVSKDAKTSMKQVENHFTIFEKRNQNQKEISTPLKMIITKKTDKSNETTALNID